MGQWRHAISPSSTSKSFLSLQHDGFCDSLQYYNLLLQPAVLQPAFCMWFLYDVFHPSSDNWTNRLLQPWKGAGIATPLCEACDVSDADRMVHPWIRKQKQNEHQTFRCCKWTVFPGTNTAKNAMKVEQKGCRSWMKLAVTLRENHPMDSWPSVDGNHGESVQEYTPIFERDCCVSLSCFAASVEFFDPANRKDPASCF